MGYRKQDRGNSHGYTYLVLKCGDFKVNYYVINMRRDDRCLSKLCHLSQTIARICILGVRMSYLVNQSLNSQSGIQWHDSPNHQIVSRCLSSHLSLTMAKLSILRLTRKVKYNLVLYKRKCTITSQLLVYISEEILLFIRFKCVVTRALTAI